MVTGGMLKYTTNRRWTADLWNDSVLWWGLSPAAGLRNGELQNIFWCSFLWSPPGSGSWLVCMSLVKVWNKRGSESLFQLPMISPLVRIPPSSLGTPSDCSSFLSLWSPWPYMLDSHHSPVGKKMGTQWTWWVMSHGLVIGGTRGKKEEYGS